MKVLKPVSSHRPITFVLISIPLPHHLIWRWSLGRCILSADILRPAIHILRLLNTSLLAIVSIAGLEGVASILVLHRIGLRRTICGRRLVVGVRIVILVSGSRSHPASAVKWRDTTTAAAA